MSSDMSSDTSSTCSAARIASSGSAGSGISWAKVSMRHASRGSNDSSTKSSEAFGSNTTASSTTTTSSTATASSTATTSSTTTASTITTSPSTKTSLAIAVAIAASVPTIDARASVEDGISRRISRRLVGLRVTIDGANITPRNTKNAPVARTQSRRGPLEIRESSVSE